MENEENYTQTKITVIASLATGITNNPSGVVAITFYLIPNNIYISVCFLDL